MDPDQTIRIVVACVAGGVAALLLLGGLLTPVAGRWRDGDRLIALRQVGPWLSGRCERPGGVERYKGWALFGAVRLERFEFGAGHLTNMGFSPEAAPLVEGRALAGLSLRRDGDSLHGTFEGRKVTFAYSPLRVLRITRLPPSERRWSREA